MRRYQIRLARPAAKFLRQLLPADQGRIAKCLQGIKVDPWVGKKLHGQFADYYSVRVHPFRIIYWIRKMECLVLVIRIGDRKDVYKTPLKNTETVS